MSQTSGATLAKARRGSTVREVPRYKFAYRILAHEIDRIAQHTDRFFQIFPLQHDTGILFESVNSTQKAFIGEEDPASSGKDRFDAYLLNGNLNFAQDAQSVLSRVKKRMNRDSRLLLVVYNPYIRPLFVLFNKLGLRRAPQPTTFLTRSSLQSVTKLAGFEMVRMVPVLQFPFSLLGMGRVLNFVLRQVPFVRWLGVASVMVLKPVVRSESSPMLSIVVPIRNEKGNLPTIFEGIDSLSTVPKEVIFVEGHSNDGTWEALQEILRTSSRDYPVRAFKQKGIGKKDASLFGLTEAKGDVLTILDGDMTVTAQALGSFYTAFCDGHADFVNGSRLVYDMEAEAMRSLNRLGNVFFAKAVSFVLSVKLSDTLCGSKMVSRAHFRAITRWNKRFGDFDPFGDFALLFAASSLGLSFIDVPVHYLARRYGSTNIQRFRHGWQLLRMTLTGFFRIKLGSS